MASRHLDHLTRQFISGSSNPLTDYDSFSDLQDPTFLTFKIDFFPDYGLSMPDDAYSSGGLLRPGGDDNGIMSYTFYDSATEYLKRIGAPARQVYLEKFITLLRDLQDKAPWYFQSVSGLGDLYRIDPAMNFRGKDKILTIECLETIDLRISLLANLYRNLAFDFEGMREVLPINLRTFNMNVHVLEFRKFNTTYGKIADALSPGRVNKGADNQLPPNRKNVFGQTTLGKGTLDNINSIGSNLNQKLGGLFSNMGDQAGDNYKDIESAFEAISVQTFELKDCEFDFYSEAPGYLDAVSVKDINEATHKFKISVGKIHQTNTYSFEDFIISDYTRKTSMSKAGKDYSNPYFERGDLKKNGNSAKEVSQSVFPNAPNETSSTLLKKSIDESDYLRNKPLENALSGVINGASSVANREINKALGNATGGVIGTTPLRNVFSDSRSAAEAATNSLNGFLTPGTQFNNGTSSQSPTEILKGVNANLTGASINPDTLGNVYKP